MIRLAIADDHQSIIDGLQLLLQNETDIEFVGTANDGKGLVELIQHKRPHIVITDIRMPNMNGIELTRFIKANYPGVKIIAFSMFDQDDAIQQMIEAGVSGYILKNSTLQEVLKAVQQVYLGETYFDPQINVEDKSSSKHEKTLLTNRQYEILKLIGEGKTTSEIAEELFIGVYTVSTHRKNMARILGLKGKGELLRYAMERKYDF